MKGNIIRIILLAICVMSHIYATAQKPKWADVHTDLPNSRIGVYYGEGSTFDLAIAAAERKVIEANAFAIGFRANVELQNDGTCRVNSHNSDFKTSAVTLRVHHTNKGGGHQVWLLVQVAKHVDNRIEPVQVTNRYNYIGESFVPGMAQIKKGQTGKGVFFIAAETVCVGGIIVSETMRSNYISKMNNTRTAKLKLSYKNKSNTWATARNIAIAGTAAFYVWNVVDGIVAKGKTHVVGPRGEHIAFAPYYNPESIASPESSGLAMCVTF